MTKNQKSKTKLIEMFIPQKGDSRQKTIQKISLSAACVLLSVGIIIVTIMLCRTPSKSATEPVVAEESSSEMVIVEPESSEPESSEILSSEETSSEITSSTATSSSASSTKTSSGNATSSKAVTPQPTKGFPEDYLPKFAEWYAANTEVKAHLVIPNTNVDYPVVQGKNNTYYLNHNLNKQSYGWGIPYLDYRVKIGKDGNSKNIMMYGHGDDKRGLMLSNMKKYRDVSFYKSHPVIQFDTVYEASQWKVITMFKEDTNAKRGDKVFQFWNCIGLGSESEFNSYIENVKARAFFTSSVDVNSSDQLLSIQVCEDTNRNNYNRLVLVCRKVRPGEDASVDTSDAAQK